jgi:hypothetical protein
MRPPMLNLIVSVTRKHCNPFLRQTGLLSGLAVLVADQNDKTINLTTDVGINTPC